MGNQVKQPLPAPAYTNQFSDPSGAVGVYTLVTPAANVNGVIVSSVTANYGSSQNGMTILTLLAKSSVPANAADGDVLGMLVSSAGNGAAFAGSIHPNVKIPAGKGVYLWNGLVSGGAVLKTATFTVL